VLIFILGIANLVMSNFLNVDSLKINAYLRETSIISKENQELQSKVAQMRSLNQIETKAISLGFSKELNIATINSIDAVAQLPN
jgi:hypothetical protein